MAVAIRTRTRATIRVTYISGRSGAGGTRCTVFVDDVEVGELRPGDTSELPVDAGDHVVRARAGWQHSERWRTSVTNRDAVGFQCRWVGRGADAHLDLCPSDPYDGRARPQPPAVAMPGDGLRRQRVTTRDGRVLTVRVHKSGYLRSLDPDSGPVGSHDPAWMALLRRLAFHMVFKGGWSVAVVRTRRLLWDTVVRQERFPTKAGATSRAVELVDELRDEVLR